MLSQQVVTSHDFALRFWQAMPNHSDMATSSTLYGPVRP
jgi:hypothetical protein